MGHFSDDVYYPGVDTDEEREAKAAEKRKTAAALFVAVPEKQKELKEKLSVDPDTLLELCKETAVEKENTFWMRAYDNNLNSTTTGVEWDDSKIVPVWRPIETDTLAGSSALNNKIPEENQLCIELEELLKQIKEYNVFCYSLITNHYMRKGKGGSFFGSGWKWKPGMKPEL